MVKGQPGDLSVIERRQPQAGTERVLEDSAAVMVAHGGCDEGKCVTVGQTGIAATGAAHAVAAVIDGEPESPRDRFTEHRVNA